MYLSSRDRALLAFEGKKIPKRATRNKSEEPLYSKSELRHITKSMYSFFLTEGKLNRVVSEHRKEFVELRSKYNNLEELFNHLVVTCGIEEPIKRKSTLMEIIGKKGK